MRSAAGGLIGGNTFGIGGYFLGKNLQHFRDPMGWVALAAFAVGSCFIWSFFNSPLRKQALVYMFHISLIDILTSLVRMQE
jgi:RsiW-degrading membrane proteinase PrsW (M82 family)